LSSDSALREAGFAPWIAWYRKLVPLGQDRPSSHFGEGLDILVATQPNEWWDRDAAEVNAEIAGWLHTHWTDERVERLKKLWADGLSASQIAAQLGGVSRNAVIGRVHRLKLERNGRTSSAALEQPTIRQFILQLLKSSEKPMSIAEINRSFADANHPIIPKTVRGELSRMASAGEIVRVRTGVYAANDNRRRPIDHELAAGLTSALTNIEEQKAGALQFETDGVAPIDVKRRASAGQLRADEAASKRHAELARRLNSCLSGCRHADPGGNSTSALREELVLYGESLGETVGDVDPDLFIPRGDGLRIDLREQEPPGDAVLGDPPWPDTVRKEVRKLVAAHNNFVAFDPELAKRDEALLGPDAKRQLVPPEAGHNAVSDAIEKRAATERVGEFLDEEGKVAPAIPDPENRQSRRYSEGAKNFARRAIELAGEFAIAAWTHKGKITVTTAGSGLAAAKWVVANRDWLLQYFSHNPTMVDIINKLLAILDKLPLL
jgi:hypothetical protein